MTLWMLLITISYIISSAAGVSTYYLGLSGNLIAFSTITGAAVGIFLIVFTKRRLNDLDKSGWWQLVNIIPLINFLLAIYLIFFPGTKGTNNFGPAPAENSSGVKIMGSVALTLFIILGIVTISGNFLFFSGTPDKGFDAMHSGDYETALKEYRPRAEQGDTDAQNSLGIMYNNGWGVDRDIVRALMWYMVAATTGSIEALDNQILVEKEMTPSQIEKAQELARECIAKNYKDC